MSKRTPGLEQRPRGFWPTPREAVEPLLPFIPAGVEYGEPCAGDGQLVQNLTELLPSSVCAWVSDIEPQMAGIPARDALDIERQDVSRRMSMWITNPPWPKIGQKGGPALPIIMHLTTIAPTWALLPFDFAAADYFNRVSATCSDIVVVGRVSWMDNGVKGKDNAAWFRFDTLNRHPTIIHPKGTT